MNHRSIQLATAFITMMLMFNLSAEVSKSDCHFVILITSYNNEQWAEENLDSACWQDSTNPYQVIYINDCSTDATGTIADQYVKKHHLEDKVTVIHSDVNKGAMANIYYAVHELIADDKIVVSLDGDDTLSNSRVLQTLEKYYADPEGIWITYGSAMKMPGGDTDMSEEIPFSIIPNGGLRSYEIFVTQHLRTFKSWLFKKIAREDLYYQGKFMSVTWDMAMMFPMLEMSYSHEANHICYIPEILYIYRMNNQLSDFALRREHQWEVEAFVRGKTAYQALKLER